MTTPASRVTADKTASRVSDELLPCPFCGSEPLSIEHYQNGLKLWAVFCHKGESCTMDVVSAVGIDEAEAIAVWNTRTLSSDSVSDGSKGVSEAARWLDEYLSELRKTPTRYADDIEGLERVAAALSAHTLDSGTGGQQPVACAYEWRFKDAINSDWKSVVRLGTDMSGIDPSVEVRLWRPLYSSPTEPKAGVVSGDWHMEAAYEQIEELQQAAQLADNEPMEALFSDVADMSLWLLAQIQAVERERDDAREEIDAAKNDLRSFMTTFVREHFPDVTQWEPLPDLLGMLSQMDNASTVARDLTARAEAAQADLARAREALERSRIAIDDWLNTFASEHCTETRVKAAWDRIAYEGGTLAYIASVQEQNRAALRNTTGEAE